MNTPNTIKSTPIEQAQLYKTTHFWLGLFMVGLVISGITAIPLEWELNILESLVKAGPFPAALIDWISFIKTGLHETYRAYPFLAYGTDWLAFAHIVIAIAFIGPLREPVKNIWVIEFGIIACLLVIPTALIFGTIRGIPFFWQLIDCSFGIIGIIPLWLCRRAIKQFESALHSYRFHMDKNHSEAI